MTDPVEDYLGRLRDWLRTPDAARVLAEARDHLHESTIAGMAAGLSEQEAQEAAISSFGSVRAVVRAHQARPRHLIKGRTPRAVLADLIMSAWKLGGMGLTAVGVSGLVVLLMNLTLGRGYVGQSPVGTSFSKAQCSYWLAGWPGARTCAQAAMLESSSDAVVLRTAAGIVGIAALAAYCVFRHLRRDRGQVLLAGYFPALAAVVFGAGAAGLVLLQSTGLTVTEGAGNYLSGAIVAAGLALWYGFRARSLVRSLAYR
jgi:hypothetical protein